MIFDITVLDSVAASYHVPAFALCYMCLVASDNLLGMTYFSYVSKSGFSEVTIIIYPFANDLTESR